MFKDLYQEAKAGDGLSIFLLLIFGLCALLIAWLAFYLIDSSFLPEREKALYVESSHYTPSHYQPQLISNGQSTITTMVYIPASWSATVKVNNLGDKASCSISESRFSSINIGDRVTARLVTGRFSSATYCKGLTND